MEFTLKLRIPGWSQNKPVPSNLYSYVGNEKDEITIKVNGVVQNVLVRYGYAQISRQWKIGDKVELVLPMKIHEVIANEKVKDDSGMVAFEYGPIVYCAEEIDNKNIEGIKIDDKINPMTVENNILNNNVVEIKYDKGNKKYSLIPYYIWSNRGIGKMKVWFPKVM